LSENQSGQREVVVAMRERGGRAFPFMVKAEADAVAIIRKRVGNRAAVFADEAAVWDQLHARYDMKRINHSFFSRLRRAEIG
jgi:hypothetical protein